MDDAVKKFCEKYDLEVDDLEDDIIELLEEGESVKICECCGSPTLEEELVNCENCLRDLCSTCFPNSAEENECPSCQDDFN